MTNVTDRRHFVKQSITTAASVAVVSQTARAAQAAPNDRVSLGVIGYGGRSRGLVKEFLNQPDAELVAVADVDMQRAASAAERIADDGRRPAVYQDFRRVIDDPAIDAVIIGTPDHWHAIPTILACLADKDVYVEKPDGHNMLEGQRMVQALRKHDRVVQLGTQARTNPHMLRAMEFISTGKLGRVLVAKAWESARQGSIGRPADSTPPKSVNYDMWLGPAPVKPFNQRRFHGSWRWFFDYGTGDLGNDGVHRIDVARWALATAVAAETGQDMTALPRTISAIGGKWYFDDIQDWPDTLQVNYEYGVPDAPGRILTYEMRIWTPYPYMGEAEGVALFGDQGYIVLGNRRWHAHAPDGEVIAKGAGGNAGAEHVRDFLDCMRTRNRPAADLESVGHPSSVMCHAGNVAWRTGKQLAIDPQTEEFDNTEANKWRGRDYRAPWVLPTV